MQIPVFAALFFLLLQFFPASSASIFAAKCVLCIALFALAAILRKLTEKKND